MRLRLILLGAPTAALLLTASPVSAAPAAVPSPYADHVVHCAQADGFTGTHNPGVHHQGYSGWQQEC